MQNKIIPIILLLMFFINNAFSSVRAPNIKKADLGIFLGSDFFQESAGFDFGLSFDSGIGYIFPKWYRLTRSKWAANIIVGASFDMTIAGYEGTFYNMDLAVRTGYFIPFSEQFSTSVILSAGGEYWGYSTELYSYMEFGVYLKAGINARYMFNDTVGMMLEGGYKQFIGDLIRQGNPYATLGLDINFGK